MKHNIIEAESACIEAIGKLSILYDYMDKKATQIPEEDSHSRSIAGGELLLVGDSLEAVQRLESFILQSKEEN